MILALFAITFFANGIYLVLFRTLMAAVEKLAAKAQAMGTPQDIIDHHREQLGRVFGALARTS